MLLEIKNASLSLDGKEIFQHIDFKAQDKEKIGIVGRNGSGKTTLLRIIEGELDIDKNDDETIGSISMSGIKKIGTLKQITFSNLKNTVEEELDSAYKEGHKNEEYEEWEKEKAKNLAFLKFGFPKESFQKEIGAFSGGERTKLALIKLLLSAPDLLILDEPTNHLDIEAIEWLSEFLIDYKKTLIVVSHDRQFLNDVCNVIYEVEDKQLTRYSGNYDYYIDKKAIDYETNLKQYEKASAEIKKLHGLYERFRYKPTKARFAQSRLKMAEKLQSSMSKKPIKSSEDSFVSKIIPKRVGGIDVLTVQNLCIGYNNKVIKNNVSFEIKRGESLAIIGRNGSGKSTILKTIVGLIPKISGDIKFGHEIDFEYFDQDIAKTNSIETVFDNFHNTFPKLTNTEVRSKLAAFLFEGDDVFKQVYVLSGGEKVRLCLAKLFEKHPNFLILDEPTNHLDILGKEALENILDEYEGTVLFVSHDRYFVNRISTKIYNLTEFDTEFSNTNILSFSNEKNTTVNYYTNSFKDVKLNNSNKTNFEEQKEKRKLENIIKKLEEKIAILENKIKIEEDKMNDINIQNDFVKLNEISENINKFRHELDETYIEWEARMEI